jgi:hypothetical protein
MPKAPSYTSMCSKSYYHSLRPSLKAPLGRNYFLPEGTPAFRRTQRFESTNFHFRNKTSLSVLDLIQMNIIALLLVFVELYWRRGKVGLDLLATAMSCKRIRMNILDKSFASLGHES